MASDYDIDFNWDDDPFGGDIDFDMDFNMDPFAGKGFFRSVATGFLSGLVDETVGSSEARFRTLRTVLPESFSNGLDRASFIKDRIDELAQEFKEENAQSAKSLQNIASHLNQRMAGKLPGFVENGLNNFSEKDFSSWERLDPQNPNFNARMDSTSNEEVDQAIDIASNTQAGMFNSLGESLNNMTVAATSILQSAIGSGNRQLVNIEGAMRDVLDYHRNFESRIHTAQLSLAARSYVQDAKFYKFMEAGVHAEVAELKKIAKFSAQSDYEKTSNFTASKAYVRNKLFSTVGKRIGGLTGLVRERFGKDTRSEAYNAFGSLVNNISDGFDMAGDTGLSRGMVGDIIGKMIAGVAVEQLPAFFTRGPGKKAIDKMSQLYPEQASYIKQQVEKLTDMGHVLSYVSTSGVGMLNHAAENYQAMDEMKYVDYEDYLDNLEPGKKPLPKSVWNVLNTGSNKMKESINKLMSDATKSRGTQYVLQRRNVKDLNQPGIWKEMNNITLNEVLPGLISKTNQILEQFRTGRDDVEAVSYNYMRGQFQTDTQKRISVQADLMPHGEFQRYAQASLSLVDGLDPDKMLSPGTRKAFAQIVAKDIDAEMGFNPYYYLGELKGVSPEQQKEIHGMLMRHFGINTEDVATYNQSDSFQRLKQMSNMPTAEGRERLNSVSASAANIKQNFPNVAERIDLLRSTGNEQMLRDLGIIYTENGIDKINMQAFHDRIGMYMDDPNNPLLRGITPGADTKIPTVANPFTPVGSKGPTVNPYEGLTSVLGKLNDNLSNLKIPEPVAPGTASTVNFDTATGELTDIKESNRGILDRITSLDGLMKSMLDLANSGKLITGKPANASDERAEEQTKKSLLQRFKGILPTNMMGRGMDFILSRNPMVLGGILGMVGSQFFQNPLMSAAVAGTGLLAGAAISYYRGRGTSSASEGSEPSDDEDIIGEDGEPLLKSSKLKAGEYYDAASKRVIKTWNDIRGPVFDAVTKAVIGARDLAGRIFGADGRAVALRGLRSVRDAAVGAYNRLDPINRIKSVINSGREMVYQQDVYVKSNMKDPALRAAKFKTNEYFVRDEAGNFKPISGWNEINGPVFDDEGNQLVSQEEYEEGLVTSSGVVVRNLGNGVSNLVGAAAGLGKAGLDKILGRFGYNASGNKAGADAATSTVGGGSASGVERRLDKIYRLLAQHFDLPMENDPDTGEPTEGSKSKGGSTGGASSGGFRLNSLAWKKRKSEEDEKHKVNQAIIKIAKNTEGLGEDEKGEEKQGIFAKIKGFLGGIATFGMNLIKNPIGTIGNLVFGSLVKSTERLGKIGKFMFDGVLGLGSPIYKLMKWGFTKLALAFAGKKAIGSLMGDGADIEVDQHGQSGKKKKGSKKKSSRTKGRGGAGRRIRAGGGIWGTLIGTGLSYAGAEALSALDDDPDAYTNGTEDLSVGERDPATGRYKTMTDSAVEMATSWLPQGQLADGLVKGVLGKENYQTLDNYGLFWSSDGKFFINRAERDGHEDKINGVVSAAGDYGTVKSNTKITQQKRIRFAMYGIKDIETNLGRRVMALENALYPYVVIRNNRASLKPDAPIEKIIDTFAKSGVSKWNDKSAIGTWFLARFKPIFMIYNAAVSVARMGDIVEFDNAKSYDVVQVVERVQQSIASLSPYPYNIDTRIDDKEGTMSPEQTRDVVSKMLDELRKELPAPAKVTDKIATAEESLANTKAGLPGQSTQTPTAEMTAQDKMGAAAARASAEAAERTFAQPADVKSIDISDLMPGSNQEMDAFTMVRLAVYGNIDNIPWRVEAVLRLERYLENYIMVMGDDARFTGKSNQILELFKASFRINSDIAANNWMIWFRDRFLPTMMTYVKEVYKLRGMNPARGWKQLTATNRAVIARTLTGQIVNTADQQKPVWEIEASPFPGSKSGIWPDRANKYLQILDAKAQEARLKDPELEEEKSKATTKEPQQMAQSANMQQRTQDIMNQVYRTGATGSSAQPGFNPGSSGAGGYYPNATMSAPGGGAGSAGAFMGKADANFNPEFIKQAGEDKGIKMSLEQGEKLMLNHLVKAGFRDNKTLALALAMARKETGDYRNTVENTNWSAPTLMKYFKNIPDAATAQKVAAMSPAERAMWVYGRQPKARDLGNQKPEDGWLYRGRGLFQLTGRANYEAFKKATGIDVVSNPRLVSEDPNVMAESAVWYLKNNKAMQSIAQTGDFDTAVRGINGGNAVPATDERRSYYNDYLNRLRSGDLNLPGTGDDASTESNDAAAMNAPTQPQVPEAADKNVPKDKVVKPEDSPVTATATTATSAQELIRQANASSPPSDVGTTNASAATNASPLSSPVAPETSAPASNSPASSSAPSPSSSSDSSVSSSAPVAQEPVSAPAPKKAAPAPAPAEPAPVPSINMPDQMNVQDQVIAKLMQASNTTLVEILKVLQNGQKQKGAGIVDL